MRSEHDWNIWLWGQENFRFRGFDEWLFIYNLILIIWIVKPPSTHRSHPNHPREPHMCSRIADIDISPPTKFFCLSFRVLLYLQIELKNFVYPVKTERRDSKLTYSDELHHDELEYTIIWPNFLSTSFFIATTFSINMNKILIIIVRLI